MNASNIITITQVNWDGQGNDRVFTRHAYDYELDAVIRSINMAYNMAHTRVEVRRNEPEWMRRRREQGLPAKDMTVTA